MADAKSSPILELMSNGALSPYRDFSADEWGKLREGAEMTLTETELEKLRGLGETISLAETEEIYLPLSRLLKIGRASCRERG